MLPATKRFLAAATATLATLLALAFSAAPADPPANLAARLDAILSDHAIWGVYVQHVESGETWYERNPSNIFLPASNQKIFTTAAALDALGSEYRYRTVLYFDGQVEGSVLKGNLVLRGSGDPTFGANGFQAKTPSEGGRRTWRIWA